MIKKIIFTTSILFVFTVSSLFAKQDKVLEEFNKQLDSISLECIAQEDFVPFKIDISKCEDVNYYYAIKNNKKKIEIRYSIYPYKKSIKEPNHVEIGSDNSHEAFTIVVVENIAGDSKNIEKFIRMKEEVAKKDFNADFGYIAIVKPKSNYGKGYKKAMIIGLYKSEYGFSYHTILFDDDKVKDVNFQPLFYGVKFKNK